MRIHEDGVIEVRVHQNCDLFDLLQAMTEKHVETLTIRVTRDKAEPVPLTAETWRLVDILNGKEGDPS